ncbi:tetratricopeptide repeat protein [Pontiellaceae bacterium B12227]|nr:tetratricopeptide repeat protein [Pontiellaceae bacterium B12227]
MMKHYYRPPNKMTCSLMLSLALAGYATAQHEARQGQDATIQAALGNITINEAYSTINIDYPFENSLFPPDLVAPTFLWHDEEKEADQWLVQMELNDGSPLYTLTDGQQAEPILDPDAVWPGHKDYERPEYERTAKAWTPDEKSWELIKQNSVSAPAVISIWGLRGDQNRVVSKGQIQISTSSDPVGAPIFYRDVPLMPSVSMDGKISPISSDDIHVIAWRLRDISKPSAPVLLKDMPTCANCHSFSSDGNFLGMDLDGPDGDKGAYGLVDISKDIVIEEEDILTWGSYKDSNTPINHSSFGLFSRVSPDGQYVVSTVNESVFVANYSDFRFLQSFYPTRGILVIYNRKTGEMKPLPGASDPRFVQTNAIWSPNGKELIFSRASAKNNYGQPELPTFAGDPRETYIQYDLYRIPFNNGEGGTARPVQGASLNGKSNSFPKYSPDGKWIVYVQAEKGQLMRPDSKLFIIPTEGGQAREMNCNLDPMNSWHSWSPNSRWLVFSSKGFGPFTKMFLTHIDENGNDTPAILIPNSTAANRAVNIPEFLNAPGDAITSISAPTQRAYRFYYKAWDQYKEQQNTEALKNVNTALRMNPYYDKAHFLKASLLKRLSREQESIKHIKETAKLTSRMDDAHKVVPYTLAAMGKTREALDYLYMVFMNHPTLPQIHMQYQADIRNNPKAHNISAWCYIELENFSGAKEQYESVIKTYSNDITALNGLAWILAGSHGDKSIAEPKRAIELATKAATLSHYRSPAVLDTLIVSYAAAGQYEQAIETAEKALSVTNPLKQPQLYGKIQNRLNTLKKISRAPVQN